MAGGDIKAREALEDQGGCPTRPLERWALGGSLFMLLCLCPFPDPWSAGSPSVPWVSVTGGGGPPAL